MKKTSGQSLVEFALVLPMIMLLIFGAMDIGRIVTTKIVMTNAAREGANYLSRTAFLDPDNIGSRVADTRALIYDYCASQKIIIDPDNDVTISSIVVGSPVSVTVEQDVDLFFGSFLQFLGFSNDGTILVSSEIQMKVK